VLQQLFPRIPAAWKNKFNGEDFQGGFGRFPTPKRAGNQVEGAYFHGLRPWTSSFIMTKLLTTVRE
jgi:hypothetical protein